MRKLFVLISLIVNGCTMNVDGSGDEPTTNYPTPNGDVYYSDHSDYGKCPPAQWILIGENWVWWDGKCGSRNMNPVSDPKSDDEKSFISEKNFNPKPIPDNNPHFMK